MIDYDESNVMHAASVTDLLVWSPSRTDADADRPTLLRFKPQTSMNMTH